MLTVGLTIMLLVLWFAALSPPKAASTSFLGAMGYALFLGGLAATTVVIAWVNR